MEDDKKPYIFLDLDLTLIYAEPLEKRLDELKSNRGISKKIKAFDPNFDLGKLEYGSNVSAKDKKIFMMDKDYIIFLRPGLQEFLDFLFKNFTVSVWTAASKEYAIFIIQYIILLLDKNEKKLDPSIKRNLDLILFYYHCKMASDSSGGYKNIKFLIENNSIFQNNKNIYILDDNQDVYDTQPDMCIKAEEFLPLKKKEVKDDFLLTKAKPILIEKLKKMGITPVE